MEKEFKKGRPKSLERSLFGKTRRDKFGLNLLTADGIACKFSKLHTMTCDLKRDEQTVDRRVIDVWVPAPGKPGKNYVLRFGCYPDADGYDDREWCYFAFSLIGGVTFDGSVLIDDHLKKIAPHADGMLVDKYELRTLIERNGEAMVLFYESQVGAPELRFRLNIDGEGECAQNLQFGDVTITVDRDSFRIYDGVTHERLLFGSLHMFSYQLAWIACQYLKFSARTSTRMMIGCVMSEPNAMVTGCALKGAGEQKTVRMGFATAVWGRYSSFIVDDLATRRREIPQLLESTDWSTHLPELWDQDSASTDYADMVCKGQGLRISVDVDRTYMTYPGDECARGCGCAADVARSRDLEHFIVPMSRVLDIATFDTNDLEPGVYRKSTVWASLARYFSDKVRSTWYLTGTKVVAARLRSLSVCFRRPSPDFSASEGPFFGCEDELMSFQGGFMRHAIEACDIESMFIKPRRAHGNFAVEPPSLSIFRQRVRARDRLAAWNSIKTDYNGWQIPIEGLDHKL